MLYFAFYSYFYCIFKEKSIDAWQNFIKSTLVIIPLYFYSVWKSVYNNSFSLIISYNGDRWEMFAVQTHLNHQHCKGVFVYERISKHRLRSTPDLSSCPVLSLCLPLGSDLKKSLQQSDWLLATLFLSEKRGIDSLSSRRLTHSHPSWKCGCYGPEGSFDSFIWEAGFS